MEMWDIYDKDRVKTGRIMKRGSALSEGDYHMIVHVCIFNSCGEMLIQQRRPQKEGWPNMWDLTAGGAARSGENSKEAAERETLEEIGYRIDLSNERPFITVYFDEGFDDYYLIQRDLNINGLTLQYEEVQKVKWANKYDILKSIEDGTFVNYHPSFIETLFAMRLCRGTVMPQLK